ncbi:hypothetical protein F4821DRAFT_235517 [Hypoxylon rubiginosum]|uniref:Uncharacterized protein n=1 Tax=Hypoxylon rubiginosum TaxID=110542 RepID=A0ACC0D4G2_9PEZI|nr:hypothetical protein F4821DRAFT_235517 [Hypoxylon rubiginosum]
MRCYLLASAMMALFPVDLLLLKLIYIAPYLCTPATPDRTESRELYAGRHYPSISTHLPKRRLHVYLSTCIPVYLPTCPLTYMCHNALYCCCTCP